MSPHWIFAVALFLGAYAVFFVRKARTVWNGPDRFPPAAWGWPEALLTIALAVFFLLMSIPAYLSPVQEINLSSIRSACALYGSIVIFLLGFLVMRNQSPIRLFGLERWRWPETAMASGAALAGLLPGVYALQWLVAALTGPEGPSAQPVVNFLTTHADLQSRLWVAGVAVVAAPVAEELIFRGCLYGMLRQVAGRLTALVVSSIVFAAIHGHVPSIPGLLLLAAGLALLYERTGSLWAPVMVHAAFNALSIWGTLTWPESVP